MGRSPSDYQNKGRSPHSSNILGNAIAFRLLEMRSLYASKISNNAIVFTFVVLSIQKHDLNLIL
jgi:hypothetical protein